MTEHAASKRQDSVVTLDSVDSVPILVQPDFINESITTNVRIKQENGGLMLLPDLDDLGGGMTAIHVSQPNEEDLSVEPDNIQPTYYVSSAIGSAFQVCSVADQENVEPDDSAPSLFLLQSNSAVLPKIEACSTTNVNCGTGSWHPVVSSEVCGQNQASSALYYVTLPRNMDTLTTDSVEATHSEIPTESLVLRVFQQDGIGTVVASDDHSTDACEFSTDCDHRFPCNPVVESDLGGGQMYSLLSVESVAPSTDVAMETEQIGVN